jgi:hypothetical protein
MGFQKIDSLYLEYGKEYKIGHYRGIYKGTRCGVSWIELNEYLSDEDECLIEFDVRSLINPDVSLKMTFSPDTSFYEFFSEKEVIQSCMEYRAVNIIVRQLIGDDTFSW